MHGCLRPFLEGEGISKKSKSWKTNSFGQSIMGNQHCSGGCNLLSSAASFVQNQRLPYKLVDICVSYKCRYIQERQESWIIFLSNKLPQKWDFSKYHEAHDFYYLLLEPFNLKYSGNSTQIVTVLPLLWKKKSCIQYQ